MIDTQAFKLWLGILGDRFGRELRAPTIRAYYEILNAELSTEEFQLGCMGCLKREAFFPSPQQIIDAALPLAAPELVAADAFDRIRAGWHYYDDPRAKEAVRLAGGQDVVFTNVAREAMHARREFITVYTALMRHGENGRDAELLAGAAERFQTALLARASTEDRRLLSAENSATIAGGPPSQERVG
jgi:hypothetical protein